MKKLTFPQILKLFQKYKPNAEISDITWFCAYSLAYQLTDLGSKEIARMLDNDDIMGFHNVGDVTSYINDLGIKEFKKQLKDWYPYYEG